MDKASRKKGVRIILVSHGNLAQAMLENIEMLMGPQKNLAAYGLQRNEKMEDFMEVLRKELQEHGSDHVLFFSDLMNGTPYNALVMLTREYPELYHITGMNLAAVIGGITARSNHPAASPARLCERTLDYVRDSILDVRLLLQEMDL